MTPYARLISELHARDVRFVLIGVYGSNYYARSGATLFATRDRDFFLPPDPQNELSAWLACESVGLKLWCSDEPLGGPLDLELAEAIVRRRALVKATDPAGLEIDLTLVMAGFEFSEVWAERRMFHSEEVEVPVARLEHIVRSRKLADRPKDRLFLATHEAALAEMRDLDDKR